MASVAAPLANAGISIFAICTFDMGYFMVKSEKVEKAIKVLTEAGHFVRHG